MLKELQAIGVVLKLVHASYGRCQLESEMLILTNLRYSEICADRVRLSVCHLSLDGAFSAFRAVGY